MQNKTLNRIFRKGLGLHSRSEFEAILSQLESQVKDPKAAEDLKNFFQELMLLFEAIDRSFTDLDRTLYLRETSLSISSKEMLSLTEEIQEQSARQAAVLERLQTTIQLLKQTEKPATQSESTQTSEEQQMEKLVEMVDFLVRSKMDFAKLQQSFYEEGLKICSVMSFRNLEIQLRSSVKKLAGPEISFDIFFTGSLFEDKDAIEFYRCNEQNLPLEDQKLSDVEEKNQFQYLNIDSPKGNGTLAILQLSSSSNLSPEEMSFRLSRISPLIPSLGSTLENIKLLQEEKQKQHMSSELDTIRLVQQTLLPPSSPIVQAGEIEMCGFYQSATECSGDWWNYFQLRDGRHVILIGDVTGHGTGSAMVCAVVKGYCDSFVDRSHLSMSQILRELNRLVFNMAKDSQRAMTMSAIAIDPSKGTATFANAGHPLPILVQGQGSAVQSKNLLNSGPILGISLDVQYKEIEFPFLKGDRIILYSDGLTECFNFKNEMYGEHRLRRLVKNIHSSATAADLNQEIIKDIRNFSMSDNFEDDLTVVVIRNLTSPSCFSDIQTI